MVSETDCIGEALREQAAGRHEAAVKLFQTAINAKPWRADYYGGLGISLAALGRLDDAAAAYHAAISLQPNLAQAYNNLAGVLQIQGKFQPALDNICRAISLRPDNAESHFNHGNLLREMDRQDEAIAAYCQALSIHPGLAAAWNNLAASLRETGRFAESVDACRHALAIEPKLVDALNNLSNALSAQGEYAEAKQAIAAALALRPDDPLAHLNSSMLRLLEADLPGAWAEYEWRWQAPKLKSWRIQCTQPQWDGSDLNGRRIFLYAEQGFGDALQFARYATLAARKGGEVILACQVELLDLFSRVEGVKQCIPRGQLPLVFDVHCPLMSLANIFQTTLDTIPATVPYLHADPSKSARWRKRLDELPGKKIGLAWSGRQYPDPRRSMRLSEMADLLSAKNVNWISLQKGPIPAEARIAPAGATIMDWTEELVDFSETAALMDGLDLIITIDSAVAHLAGAMGKPVWVLLPFVPDWRWMLGREDSPWYPTMRLFRQETSGDWRNPLERVTKMFLEGQSS